ncbi:hypothetical protein I4U23_004505 [Adineta vaga]|nr:hypothetical protein I4U23_004505 [Adineta vaga]
MKNMNEKIIELLDTNNLPTIDILDQTKEDIQQLGNDILGKLNTFVLATLQLPMDKILLKLRKRHDNIFMTVENFAYIIWNRIDLQQEINEQEMELLRNIGLLNRTMIDLDMDEHDAKCFCMIEYVTAPLILKKECMKIFESIIKNVNNNCLYYQQNFSILNIICQWLDTISHIHYFLRMRNKHLGNKQDPFTKTITMIIMAPIYRQYLEKHCHIHTEMNLIEQFYVSTCSFYYAFISLLENWIDIIEPLLYYCRKFIILHCQSDSEQWSSKVFYCIKSYISLITQYYENLYSNRNGINQRMIKITNISFDNNDIYIKSILNILNNKSIQEKLSSTWSNDETITIDMIITYLLRHLYTLRSTDTINTLYIFVCRHDLYEPLQTRIFTLLSFILNDTILYELNLIKQITSLYYTRMEQTLIRLLKTKDDIEEDNMKIYLSDFIHILTNDCVQEEIIKLNKLEFFVNLEDRFYCMEKSEILWTLSFHSQIKPLLKTIQFSSKSINNVRLSGWHNEDYIEQASWGILWNLGDHQGLTQARKQYREYWRSENILTDTSIVDYDVIISYYESNIEQVEKLTKSLRGNGIRPLLFKLFSTKHTGRRNVMIDIMEKLGNIKHFIICLSENYVRSNFCRAILQYIHKKQLIIIPVILENQYTITHDWLYYIIGSSSIINYNEKDIISQLMQKLTNSNNNVTTEHKTQLQDAYDDHITDDDLHDLYNDCKDNQIDKIRSYIDELTIRQINKQESTGSTSLHVSAYYGHYEIVKLLLSYGAWRSIRNKFNLTAYEEARTEKIRHLLLRNNDNYYFVTDLHDNNYQEILEKFQKYYLSKLKLSLNLYFTMAIEENDLRYVLSAYTSPTPFHKILNRDLAIYALHYFDSTIKKTQDYSFSNSIFDLISLIIYSNQLDSLYCQNIVTTYRGMLLTCDDLKKYNVGSEIMNVTFLSTSKNKHIAEIFAGEGGIDCLRQTPDHKPIHLSTLCIYHIKNSRTALQLASISEVSDEEEILILPFSAFEIVSVRKYNGKQNNGSMMEIELDECDETV